MKQTDDISDFFEGNDIAVGPLKPANLYRFAGFLAFFS